LSIESNNINIIKKKLIKNIRNGERTIKKLLMKRGGRNMQKKKKKRKWYNKS
jgi:hypothetical protein